MKVRWCLVSKVSRPPLLTRQQGRSALDKQLDKLLERREELESVIADANTRHAERLAKLELRHQKELGKAPKRLIKLDAKLAAFLERHRYWLTRRHSKTIVRPFGEVKEVLRAVELDKPGDTKSAVDLLLARPGGKRYLKRTYTLDLRKLRQAPPELRATLRPLGFWWGRHRTLTVKSPSSKEPKQLSRRRFNERS